MQDLLDSLNNAQRKAVETNHCAELIVAGAGSGKTRVITYKIAYIIEQNLASPEEITALTFTNKAAKEMKERVVSLLEERGTNIPTDLLTISTFHSFCANVLRAHGYKLGYTKNFTIYSTTDQKQLLLELMKTLNIDPKKYQPKNIISYFASIKNETVSIQPKGPLAELYEEYNKALKKSDAMDFGDLLRLTYKLFTDDHEVLNIYQDGAKFLFVDEYQDTNKLQYKLIKLLSLHSDTICVVGDEDQSIYKWRGADISNILHFEKDFKNTVVIKLEQNYRSTANIIGASSSLIAKNIQRKEKKLFTDNTDGEPVFISSLSTDTREAEYIADKIEEYRQKSYSYDDFAVLYRINAQSRLFEDIFRKRNIPYTLVGTTGFYDRVEIKDLTAYLRFILNPHDNIALSRIISVPSKGIGKQTVESISGVALSSDLSYYSAIATIIEDTAYPSALRKKLDKLNKILQELIALQKESPSLILESVVDKISYIDYLKTKYKDNSDERIKNVSEFVSAASSFEETKENADLSSFLESISLNTDEPNSEENGVRLMTLHSAKGLEFPIVFIAGLEQNLLPYRKWGDEFMDIEEERRLAYVGMTRAKNVLFLTLARSRRIFGNYASSIPSIFIGELDTKYTKLYQDSLEFFTEPKTIDNTDYVSLGLEATKKQGRYVGAKVYHNSYGYGIIKKIEETGENTKVTVFFKNYGAKKLIWEYAKLQLC